jgi:hypothetical protein
MNARRNADRIPWASAMRDSAVQTASRWTSLDDDFLWSMVTEQSIGRSTNASVVKGCPRCGDGINRQGGGFKVDVLGDPWKISCPNCLEKFPTNDFGAFYRSGKSKDGLFHPESADRSLLFNVHHPDQQDPEHLFGVDDGMGWIDETGESFKLVGVYGHYGVWNEVRSASQGLMQALLLTGERSYAHKAGILLARIADVYPNMDWSYWAGQGFFNSDGLSGRGRIYGRIWEPSLLMTFTRCYDIVRTRWSECEDLFQFLGAKQQKFNLTRQDTLESLSSHFERNVICQGIDGIVSGDIARNEPGDQVTMAALAVALNAEDTDKWLDWIFQEGKLRGQTPNGGHIPQLFAGEIDRDGIGSEAAPSYSLGWLHKAQGMDDLDEIIRCRPDYTRNSIREFGRYRQMFLGHLRMICLGKYIPAIGDTGNTGNPNLCGLTVEQCLEGLEQFGDPIFAQAAHLLTDGDLTRLHRSFLDKDPDGIVDRVKDLVETHGVFRLRSELMTGYGLGLLRDGDEKNERALWVYYGRNTGHGHTDRLNLGLYAFGLDLLPDLGYPEHARVWPKRSGWTNHTISHNTVMVDRTPQTGSYSGNIRYFGISKNAQVISVASPEVYRQCDTYTRTSVLIKISDTDFYVLDHFEVKGGNSHHFLFHAAEGPVEKSGLSLTEQKGGTFAGEDIPFGEFFDGEVKSYKGSGFQYLYDVRRCTHPDNTVSVEWSIQDTWQVLPTSREAGADSGVKLRWSMLNPPGGISLCHGDPPSNKPGNPRRLTYVVAENEGNEGLESSFLSIIEAYKGQRQVLALEEVGVPQQGSRVLKVRLSSGRTDTLFFSDGAETIRLEGGLEFNGLFGVYSESAEGPTWAAITGGTILGKRTHAIQRHSAEWRGVVRSMGNGEIRTDASPPGTVDLVGSYITVENDNPRDACYRIEKVTRSDQQTIIDVGDVNFTRGMVDDLDYSKGFLYDFEPEQHFRVVLTWSEQFR